MHQADATGNPPEWRSGAACLHHEPDLFFPEGTAGPALISGPPATRNMTPAIRATEIWAARFATGAPHRLARMSDHPRPDRPPGHLLTD